MGLLEYLKNIAKKEKIDLKESIALFAEENNIAANSIKQYAYGHKRPGTDFIAKIFVATNGKVAFHDHPKVKKLIDNLILEKALKEQL